MKIFTLVFTLSHLVSPADLLRILIAYFTQRALAFALLDNAAINCTNNKIRSSRLRSF